VPDYYQYRPHKDGNEQVESVTPTSGVNDNLLPLLSVQSTHHISNGPAAITTTVYNPTIRHYAQEAETGQIVLNLTRHRGLLRLALHMIQDKSFFQRLFNGDKDIFRFVFLITGVPFHYN